MTAAIIWLVIWVLIFFAVPTITAILAFTLGGAAAMNGKTDKSQTVGTLIGLLVGGLAGLALWITAAVNGINQIVTIIQLI